MEQKVPETRLLPGMILSFAYNIKGVYDRRPLFFFIYNDAGKIHGLNLNYLNEYRVQRLFQIGQALTPVIEENLLGLPHPYYRLTLTTPIRASAVGGQQIYQALLKRDKRYRDAYRTYFLNKAATMRVVNYNIDVLSTLRVGRKTTVEAIKRREEEK